MNRVLGIVLLVVGVVLLLQGWRAHELVVANAAAMGTTEPDAKSIWLLAVGAVASIWGLFTLLRRTVA